MRIIGGKYKNRRLTAPNTASTRPMTDEIREAVFNILGPIDDFLVLDCYAGSGAIGFEALSRGAKRVDMVERSVLVCKTIMENTKSLGVDDEIQIYRQGVGKWASRYNGKLGGYDLIFCDPPFANVNPEIIQSLSTFIQPKGIIVIRTPAQIGELELDGLELLQTRRYGDSVVTFYRFSDAA